MASQSTESCSWCDRALVPGDGWRVQALPGARRAAFCRLEHVVPWSIQGAHWRAGELDEPGPAGSLDSCAHCGEGLADVHVLAVRHRGEHRIADAFCSTDHLADWAKAGGRWG
ncbi:MAG TPA: hypothetical protein VEQ61_06480 [Thermoleophilaceae bacterium]|nr:hypothetical protein [Thermoleophilaceae bacterium]